MTMKHDVETTDNAGVEQPFFIGDREEVAAESKKEFALSLLCFLAVAVYALLSGVLLLSGDSSVLGSYGVFLQGGQAVVVDSVAGSWCILLGLLFLYCAYAGFRAQVMLGFLPHEAFMTLLKSKRAARRQKPGDFLLQYDTGEAPFSYQQRKQLAGWLPFAAFTSSRWIFRAFALFLAAFAGACLAPYFADSPVALFCLGFHYISRLISFFFFLYGLMEVI